MTFDSAAYLRVNAQHSLGASPSGMAFATSTGDVLEVSCFGDKAFRLRVGPDTRPDYGMLLSHARPCTVTEPKFGTWRLSASDAAVEIAGSPLHLRLLHKGVPILTSSTDLLPDGTTRLPTIGRLRHGEQWTAAFALGSGESVYGLGEKQGPLDKRGQLIHSQVENPLAGDAGLGSKNAPFAWSPGSAASRRGAWGLFVHTPGLVIHGIGYPEWSHRSHVIVVDDEALDVFLIAGDAPADILDAYAELTGRAPAVPTWSLGLWVSRQYASPQEAIATAARLRDRRLPCDAITLAGNSAWNPDTGFDFEWDTQRFANARATLAAIKAHHFKVCVAECPYVSVDAPLFEELAARRFLLADADGEPFILDRGEAGSDAGADSATPSIECGIVDFTNAAAFAWWRDAHEKLFADGVDAIKTDFGNEVPDEAFASNRDNGMRMHNAYPLLYNRCVFEATRKFGDESSPPIVIAHAGWSGSQRYPVGSSGESQNDWEGLAASIRGALSWGMSGVPLHVANVGGPYPAGARDGELLVRWLQAAVFSSHLCVNQAAGREPWAFGAEAENIARKWLAFRYRLIPYLLDTIAQSMRSGLPVMRAMPLAFPGNALVRNFDTQFMCGDALLVAPITQPGGEVEIAMPPGGWYDLNSRARVAGQRVLRYRAAADQFPVFGREGHVLPLGPAVQHTAEIDTGLPLERLWIFGRPTRPLAGFSQAAVTVADDGSTTARAARGIEVEIFGDATDIRVETDG